MLTVSEPQRLTIQEVTVRGFSHWLTAKGFDPHEFAEEYVRRTEQLGYAPAIAISVAEFVRGKKAA